MTLALALAFAVGCAKKLQARGEGGACGPGTDAYCASGLFCVEGVCASREVYLAAVERENEAARRAAIEKEQRLLEEAGADLPAGEAGGVVAAAGTAVRVVEIADKTSSFAACRSTERLIGGACKGAAIVASHPSDFGERDTVGARWTCASSISGTEVTAVAMCAAVEQR